MNDDLKKKLFRGQATAWIAAMAIVAVVLLVNRVFEHPSLIVGPVTIMLLYSCFMIARSNLQKFIDEFPKQDS